MNVIVSKRISSRFYHREDCLFVTQIPEEERLQLTEKTAVRMGYHPCGCWKTDFSVSSLKKIPELPPLRGLSYEYDCPHSTIYVRTACGFWKMIRDNECLWVLFHRNTFDAALSTDELKQGEFHRQNDVERCSYPQDLARYIRKHDIAKRIIRENYRNLPRTTKQEREYYEKARRKAREKEQERLDHLFDMLDSGVDNRDMLDY